jgi:hypothetical protein
MKRPLLALSASLLLVACQSSPLPSSILSSNPSQAQPKTALKDMDSPQKPQVFKPISIDTSKPQSQALLKSQGNEIKIKMQLPPLPEANPSFATKALDLVNAAKITATLTDSNGNVYQPVGADGNGQVAYPPSGNLNLDFSNVFPDRLIVAELKVFDSSAVLPTTDVAVAFSHLATSNASAVMNFSTTAGAKALKSLIGSNATRARAISLADLQTLSDVITGKAGTAPNLTYTTHPTLVNTTLLATDLATQNPTALTAANYRLNGATVNVTVAGLVATDVAELQVTDAASPIKQNVGNGATSILKVAVATDLKFQGRSFATPGTNYTFSASPNTFTTTEGGTQVVNVTATPATPSITSLNTSNGAIGSSVTITGTNFHTALAGNVVKFGTTTATVTAASATSLTVTVPAGISGAHNVTVSVGTQTNAGTNNYTVTPSITSLSANNGVSGDSITITGTGFDGATMANNTVKFGTTTATVTAATATSLTVTVPNAPGGAQNVTVQVGSQTSSASAFNMNPTITSLSANNGVIGSNLTLTGTGFDSTAANNTVKFGTTTATVTAATATSLTVTVPAAISGTQNVTVTVGGQTNAGTHNYAVTPSITSLSATSGVSGDSITLNGTGFDTTPANNTVKFGTIAATVTAATATSLTVTVPTAVSGAQNVTVQVGTQTSASSAFTMKPKITALTTTAGQVGGKTVLVRRETLTLVGTGFDLTTAGNNLVKFGATGVAATAVVGQNIEVPIPVGITSGDLSITVDVSSQSSNAVTATVPVIAVNISGGYK